MSRLILASGSPRRKALLTRMGYAFEVRVSEADENVAGRADELVALLAERKARASAVGLTGCVVVASDTLVSLDGKPLGKPADEAEAVNMLSALSGREHEVFTGVCVLDTDTGRTDTRVDRTGVTFRTLSEAEVRDYVATGEPMDKAGAYGIQGGAGEFVSALDGSFENVMGFPVDLVREMLDAAGVKPENQAE